MTDLGMIALQAKELVVLKGRIKATDKFICRMKQKLIGIGSPLNDNRLGFNPPQLKHLQGIYDDIISLEEELNPEE